ncbi:vacuolar protein sorting-associated protein 54-like protein [Cladorrhinum sp. PSN259]|nr:vacuolar protein sorting-associated protein 54-like protein [Cladorrhinum sp. PSN259]
MYSNQGGRKSVDSLSSTISAGHRTAEFPFHGKGPHSPQRPHHRRDSTASSIVSVGGSLDASAGWASSAVFESGQNAISTLLQPPIVRTGLLPHTSAPSSTAHKPPTNRDIPPVTLTNVPHVEASEFKGYLSQVGALYEQLRRIQAEEDENANAIASQSHRRSIKPDDLPGTIDEGHLRPARRPGVSSRRTSTASITSLSSIDSPTLPRRSSSGLRNRQTQGPPPLSTVPAVYFDDDFHLENPRTFDVVSERSEVVRPVPGSDEKGVGNGQAAAPRKALATNAILQEKLSWYMDTIEWHLIQSISTASMTFFSALGSLRELHSEAADSVDRIRTLRKELEALDGEIATGGLHIVQQRRRRENVKQLQDAVMQLRRVVDGVAVCESLVDVGEVNDALENIDTLEIVIEGGMPDDASYYGMNLIDLRGATALQGVSSDLDTLRLRIGKTYETRFLNTLLSDLRSHVEQVSTQEVLMRWSSASNRGRVPHGRDSSVFPSYMAATDVLRIDLVPSLTGLQKAKYLTAAATAYREAAMREIRAIIRRPLPSSNDDDNESLMSTSTRTGGRQRSQQDRSITLATNLRALEPQDAEELLVKIYIGVTEALRRLSTQVKVLLDVASSIGESLGPSGLRSPPLRSPQLNISARPGSSSAQEAQEEIHRAVDISNFLGQAVDVAQEKIVKLLRVRSEQSKRLELLWFLRYFTLNLHFANECEAISGRSGTSLKTVVNGHIKEFVQAHGDTQNQKLAQGMESDRWDAVDFIEKNTELLNQILESSTRDAASWLEGTRIWLPHPDVPDEEGSKPGPDSKLDALSAQIGESTQTNGTTRARAKSKSSALCAIVDGERFLLPHSAVLCMNGMAQFLHLTAAIPTMTSDISASLISYLQLFNSRCTQLILGAGATRSAGLKNITTKHLALASQALAFMAAIIPHVREFVRRHCGAGATVSTIMGEFDKVRRALMEHQNNIYDKLVDIMTGRAAAAVRKLKALSWNPPTTTRVHEYVETLAKETATLHRNLVKHLPEGTVRMIMMPVFKNYKDTFGAAYQMVELETEAGREAMIRDVEFFQSRLGNIDGFEDAADYLLKVVGNKQVLKAPEPVPAPSSLAPPPTSSPAPPTLTIPSSSSSDDGGGKKSTEKAPEEPQQNGSESGIREG